MQWLGIVIVLIILSLFLFKKEGLSLPPGVENIRIALVPIPAHDSGKASMWVPREVGAPSYDNRVMAGLLY